MPAEGSHMVRRGVLFPSQRICCAFSLQALAQRPLHVSRLPRPPLMLTTHSMRGGGGETVTATNGRVRWRAATGAWPYNRPCAQQYVGKYQTCMFISGRLTVHAPVQEKFSALEDIFGLIPESVRQKIGKMQHSGEGNSDE